MVGPGSARTRHGANDQGRHALNEPLSIEGGVVEGSVFCCYRCANFAGGVLPNRAALAGDWVANLAMSSRRRNFCFLNLLNLALSPFCDDMMPSFFQFVRDSACRR